MNNPSSKKKNLIVVCGPTAVGKTGLAIKVAQHFNTAIISADSRQFYKEMSIGTAKPSTEELALVKHYFINNLNLNDEYSAGQFEKEVLDLLKLQFNNNENIPMVMAGGSGLFIKAVCEGFDELPEIDNSIRDALNLQYESNGIGFLQNLIQEKDPEYFAIVDQQNPQRLIRALEVIESTGNTFSSYRNKKAKQRDFNICYIGLNMERDLLYNRINKRVDLMLENGLLDEVKSLYHFKKANALQTVGYSELFSFLDGDISFEKAVELIKRNSRRYAKRQLTWFNKIKSIEWFNPTNINAISKYIEVVCKIK